MASPWGRLGLSRHRCPADGTVHSDAPICRRGARRRRALPRQFGTPRVPLSDPAPGSSALGGADSRRSVAPRPLRARSAGAALRLSTPLRLFELSAAACSLKILPFARAPATAHPPSLGSDRSTRLTLSTAARSLGSLGLRRGPPHSADYPPPPRPLIRNPPHRSHPHPTSTQADRPLEKKVRHFSGDQDGATTTRSGSGKLAR